MGLVDAVCVCGLGLVMWLFDCFFSHSAVSCDWFINDEEEKDKGVSITTII